MTIKPALVTALLLLFQLVGCKFNKQPEHDASEVKFLNEHSRRRPSTAEESTGIFRLKTYGGNVCTAFAVRNEAKKPIIFTARHCMNYTASDWCTKVGEIKSADERESYRCKAIIFDPKDSDFAAMELDRQIPDEGFVLGDFDPPVGRRLKMIGYPSDWYAKTLEGTVTTENCWLTNVNRQSTNVETKITPRPVGVTHNCATYGGNSGGPILLENSNIVMGLPASFWRSGNIRSMNETAFAYPAKDMISKHRNFIDSEKLITTNEDLNPTAKNDFLSRSRCSSATMTAKIEELIPIYSSEADFTALKVKFVGFDWLLFRCKEDNSCEERTNNSGEIIKIKSNTEITYTKKGESAEFRCESF